MKYKGRVKKDGIREGRIKGRNQGGRNEGGQNQKGRNQRTESERAESKDGIKGDGIKEDGMYGYRDYEGPVEGLVREKLREIEERENVRILHAVESGSRAWGFASPDSDYDVRFIYVRDRDSYLSLRERQDFLDWELNEVLDINGWDLKKVLQHFHKSNATLFEWANSPVVYDTTDQWRELYEGTAKQYFSPKSALYHYYGTANKNYHEYLLGEMVRYKKYFYVLRPLLACRWIEQRKCPPPVLFEQLADAVLEEELKKEVSELLEKKMQMSESEKAPRLDGLNRYIERKLEYYKALAGGMEDDRKPEWEPLEEKFRELLEDKGAPLQGGRIGQGKTGTDNRKKSRK